VGLDPRRAPVRGGSRRLRIEHHVRDTDGDGAGEDRLGDRDGAGEDRRCPAPPSASGHADHAEEHDTRAAAECPATFERIT